MSYHGESNKKILDLLTKYVNESPELRFGQILFNLDINQFASPDFPWDKDYLCRDIHPDSSEAILKRVEAAIKNNE